MSSPRQKGTHFDNDDAAYETTSESESGHRASTTRRRNRSNRLAKTNDNTIQQQTQEVPYFKSAKVLVRDGAPYTIGIGGKWFHFDSLIINDAANNSDGVEYKDLIQRMTSQPQTSRATRGSGSARQGLSRQRSYSAEPAAIPHRRREQRPSVPELGAERPRQPDYNERQARYLNDYKTFQEGRTARLEDERKAFDDRNLARNRYAPPQSSTIARQTPNPPQQQMQLYRPPQPEYKDDPPPYSTSQHDYNHRDYHHDYQAPVSRYPPQQISSTSSSYPYNSTTPNTPSRPRIPRRISSDYNQRTSTPRRSGPSRPRLRTRTPTATARKHVRFAPLPTTSMSPARPGLQRQATGPQTRPVYRR